LWVDYQLLGHAAAAGDSLKDTARLDKVLWPMIAEARVNAFHDTMLARGPKFDSTANESRYGQGEVLAARHILFRTTADMSPAQKDSVRRRAEATRARLTNANFAQIAGQTNDDPTAKQQGGNLGLFPRGAMVKEFEQAVLGLQPGQISPLVETQFGYHIIRRAPYSEVRGEIGSAMQRRATQVADSTFVANLEAGANVQLKDDAPAVARAVVADVDGHRDDKTVLATTKIGNFTAEKFGRWVRIFPQRPTPSSVSSSRTWCETSSFCMQPTAPRSPWIRSSSPSCAVPSRRSLGMRGRSSGSRPRSSQTARRRSRSVSAWPRRASKPTSIAY
jgi:peptidyl-prolyl cis-trans isomerase D